MAPDRRGDDCRCRLRMTISRLLVAPACSSPHRPSGLIDPSPMTGDELRFSPLQVARHGHAEPRRSSRAVGRAERVEFAFGALGCKPDNPPPWRSVRMRSRRPVRILCG